MSSEAVKLTKSVFTNQLQWWIQDFPWGGGLHFVKFAYQNERSRTLGSALGVPPGSATELRSL